MNKFTPPRPAAARTVDEITGSRRLRRMRKADWSRRLVQENRLTVDDLIWPIFVIDGENRREEIAAMPGVFRLTIDLAVKEAERAAKLGIPAIATFPNVDLSLRDQTGSHILDPDNVINRATRAIKAAVPEIGIITDAALDPFTSHGHDGILRDGIIVNDETVAQVTAAAVLQAEAGADIIAPSDMMDGRIGAIRDALDAAGFQDVAIMSYATKFASAFYGPYREAVGTAGLLKGDKKTYYIDHANSRRSRARGRAGHPRGRRHDHGQARPALSRHHPPAEGRVPDADLRLPGVGRILDDRGCRRQWLDRRRQGDAGIARSPSSAPAATAS